MNNDNERDMYYSGYGYGYMPMTNPTQSNMPMQNWNPNDMTNQSNYATSQFNDITERIGRLERQVKRLDQRLTRLETPYANNQNYTEPDNNMYMM